MIVVDTSVWIAHFRNEPSAAVTKLPAIANPDDIVVGDPILLECLQGAAGLVGVMDREGGRP